MRKVANITGTVMAFIGGTGISLLFCYAEWLIIQENWVQFLNPLLTVTAMVVTVTWPVTWVAIALCAIGLTVAAKTEIA